MIFNTNVSNGTFAGRLPGVHSTPLHTCSTCIHNLRAGGRIERAVGATCTRATCTFVHDVQLGEYAYRPLPGGVDLLGQP